MKKRYPRPDCWVCDVPGSPPRWRYVPSGEPNVDVPLPADIAARLEAASRSSNLPLAYWLDRMLAASGVFDE